MSKEMETAELMEHCKKAINEIENTLLGMSVADKKMRKRAMLIGYWLKTYIKFIRNEDTFSPEKVYRLKRGSVVQVEFGYRIGSELGGKHYAVVVDAKNEMKANTVTVVPLGSIKEKTKDDENRAILKSGVYELVSRKLNVLIEDAKETISEVEKMREDIARTSNDEEIMKKKTILRQKTEDANKLLAQAKMWSEEMEHMKEGSVALIGQITTISKMRITAPLKKTHPLYGTILTPEDLYKIDNKLLERYFKKIEHNA